MILAWRLLLPSFHHEGTDTGTANDGHPSFQAPVRDPGIADDGGAAAFACSPMTLCRLPT
jgi:hypothetical protein